MLTDWLRHVSLVKLIGELRKTRLDPVIYVHIKLRDLYEAMLLPISVFERFGA